MQTPSDQVLIDQILQNDPVAFESLLARYEGGLRRHILRFIRENETARDLTQETFLRVWTHADQWDGRGSLKAWLFRIATNLALNHLRTIKRQGLRPLTQPPDDEGDWDAPAWLIDQANDGPDNLAERSESYRLLRELVERLPEEKREVFLLAHEAELDTRDIANRLGIPPGTVKSRLHYANKRLASEWEEMQKEWEEI